MDSTEQTTRHAAPPPLVWTFTIVHHLNPSTIGRRLVLEEGVPVTLGRELAVLDGEGDRKLSRVHAVARVVDDQVVLEDQRSRNGTFVDGVRVERADLSEDSVVGVGHVLLLCQRRPPFFVPARNPRVSAISAAMSEVLSEVSRAAPRRDAVTLVGDTGVGKGLLAEELHLASGRKGPFVPVHCGALADERLHAQLFGEGDAHGLLEGAEGGTLFLDGVDDARPALQAALLTFLERGEVRRVGEPSARALDVRVVASSREGLRVLVTQGRIRADFAARLGAISILIPPLRARREDVGVIAASFLEGLEGAPRLHHGLALALLRHSFPGNVRELFSVLEYAASDRDPDSPSELRLSPRIAAVLSDSSAVEPEPVREGVVVSRNGAWFEAPEVGRVSLESRKQLERLLAALVEAHLHERVSSVADLIAIGWPGEKVLPRAGASRVYVSITSLRKLGLRSAIERSPDGYLLSPRVRIE